MQHELQRHISRQPRVVRPVDDAHPAFANPLDHAIVAKQVADMDAHGSH
jgi:hypothetical protein